MPTPAASARTVSGVALLGSMGTACSVAPEVCVCTRTAKTSARAPRTASAPAAPRPPRPGAPLPPQAGEDPRQGPEDDERARHEAPPAVDAGVTLALAGLARL